MTARYNGLNNSQKKGAYLKDLILRDKAGAACPEQKSAKTRAGDYEIIQSIRRVGAFCLWGFNETKPLIQFGEKMYPEALACKSYLKLQKPF